jgi:DNA-binding HxlR family transcriptional regulator
MYNKKIPFSTDCGVRITIEVIGGKWKPYIIYELNKNGSMRPSEIFRIIPEASERVVNQQLKELLEYGVIQKQVIDPVCKHSEYSLTPLGESLLPIILSMRSWGDDFRPQMKKILEEKE